MSSGAVERARALVGVPFRAQGRNPAIGVDCVGLTLHAFNLPMQHTRINYRLRGKHAVEIDEGFRPYFEEVSCSSICPGDVLLLEVARDQLHLAIACGQSFVHADAGIRYVVETPGPPPWPIWAAYRYRDRESE